jgi:hypothetical protein
VLGIFALQGALVSVCGQVESVEPLGSFASIDKWSPVEAQAAIFKLKFQ